MNSNKPIVAGRIDDVLSDLECITSDESSQDSSSNNSSDCNRLETKEKSLKRFVSDVSGYIFGDMGTPLGRGAFGEVHKAYSIQDKKYVAMKIWAKSNPKFKKNRRWHQAEVDALGTLDHPNIVKCYRVVETKAHYALVMELCENREMFTKVVKEVRFSEPKARQYFIQLINGLEHAHERGHVHRDIKPENLLLCEKGEVLKICDWGFAAQWAAGAYLTEACGSPHYAAPEIFKYEYEGPEVDAWSAGVVLYTMVTGKMPFLGETHEDLMNAVKECRYRHPLDGELSPALVDLFSKIFVLSEWRWNLRQIKRHSWVSGTVSVSLFEKHIADLCLERERATQRHRTPRKGSSKDNLPTPPAFGRDRRSATITTIPEDHIITASPEGPSRVVYQLDKNTLVFLPEPSSAHRNKEETISTTSAFMKYLQTFTRSSPRPHPRRNSIPFFSSPTTTTRGTTSGFKHFLKSLLPMRYETSPKHDTSLLYDESLESRDVRQEI